MATQTGSIDFKATGGFKSYASGQYTTKTEMSDAKTYVANAKANYGYQYKKDIVIYGESSKYYPVYFTNVGAIPQTVTHEIMIRREYSEQAPSDWYTSTHKGGLNIHFGWNFGGWGGATYKCEVYEFTQMYSTMVGDVLVGADNGMFSIVYLRGGGTTGALYHVYSDVPFTRHAYMTNAGVVGENDVPYIGLEQGVKYAQSTTGDNPTYKWNVRAPLTAPNTAHLNELYTVQRTALIESRVSTTETAIEQNKNDILLKANSSDVYTKQESDGLISTEVTNRNAAIQVSANAINQSVSETYTTKEEFNDLEIGGRNYVLDTSGERSWDTATETYFLSDALNELSTSDNVCLNFDIKSTMAQWADAYYVSAQSGGSSYNNANNPFPAIQIAEANKWYHVSWEGGAGKNVANAHCLRIRSNSSEHGSSAKKGTVTVKNLKLEKGNRPTSWSPAPEDIEAHFVAVESSITQTADSITESVSKNYTTKEESKIDRSGSGTSALVDGAASATLKGLHILGESVQDGTPTPSTPVDIQSVGGVNLLPPTVHNMAVVALTTSYISSNPSWRGMWCQCLPNTDYVVTRETVTGNRFAVVSTTEEPANNVPCTVLTTLAANTTAKTLSVTTPSDARYLFIYLANNGATIAADDIAVVPAERFGYPIVPYGCLGVSVAGSNLLTSTEDMSHNVNNAASNGSISFSEGTVTWTTTSTGWPYFVLTKDAIPIATLEESDTLTLSIDLRHVSGGNKVSLQVCTTNADLNPSTRRRYINDDVVIAGSRTAYPTSEWARYTVTVPTDMSKWDRQESGIECALVANLYYNDTGTIEVRHPQLELGSESNEYEPYSGTVTPIPLNGHELRSLPDGTQDELTVDVDGHVTMTQRVGVVDLGTLGWASLSSPESHVFRTIPSLTNIAKPQSNNYAVSAISNEYVAKAYAPISASDDGRFALSTDGNCLVFIDHRFSDVESFAAAAANAVMQYKLATEQTIDLGTIDMPQVQDRDTIEVIAAVTPSIDATWWAAAGQAVADAYANLSSAIEVRAESITSTVASNYATKAAVQEISTQIEQTATGWTAKFNQLTGGEDLTMTLAEAFESLGVTSANLEQIRSFVRITTDSSGDPLLLMGSATSPIMLALSNDSLEFRHGADRVAYIDVDSGTNEGMLHITRAVVVKELQFGSWKWFEREGNGNMALKWVGEEE